MALAVLSKVGFFHFGIDHEKPVESLRSALSTHAKECLVGSLIVLPEALNIRRDYWVPDKPDKKAEPDASVKSALETVARCFNVAFVVGLIDPGRRSSAYLIDGHDPPTLICHKVSDDGKMRYEPYRENDAMRSNPFLYKGSCVAALICNDASYDLDQRVLELRQPVKEGSRAVR
jgi:hypothetical protein